MCTVFPSPHSGILFLCLINAAALMFNGNGFPSPHSGILFLYVKPNKPIIFLIIVSVPSFGDSFFIQVELVPYSANSSASFRPLIRGFFFYNARVNYERDIYITRFRPLIRGFFFYGQIELVPYSANSSAFPSPHSGILFLLRRERGLSALLL